jgi:hypothetical protein
MKNFDGLGLHCLHKNFFKLQANMVKKILNAVGNIAKKCKTL